MLFRLTRYFLLGLLCASLVVGCAAQTSIPPTAGPMLEPTNTAEPVQVVPTTPTAKTPAPSSPPGKPTLSLPSGWTVFSNPNYVTGAAVHDGHLWAATMGGVIDWDLKTDKHTLYTTRDGLVEIQSNDIVTCEMPEQRIFVAHETAFLSMYDLDLKKWSRLPITFDDGSTITGVHTLLCDADGGRLFIGSPEGLGIMDIKSGRWRRIGQAEGLNVNIIHSIDVIGQTIWIAAGPQSAFMIQGNSIFPFNGASGFPSGPVNDLAIGADGSLWLGYPANLVHYKDKKWNAYSGQTPVGIPFQSVDFVEVDSQGTVWIASASEGVCPFDPARLSCSTIYPVLENAPITDLVVDEEGIAYAATEGTGVIVMAPDEVSYRKVDQQQLTSNDVMDVAGSLDGMVWAATDRGINVIDPGRPDAPWGTIVPETGGLRLPQVSGLQPGPAGMWIFYEHEPQVSMYSGTEWTHLDGVKGISGPVLASTVDHRGYVWFATEQGIDIWDGSTMRSYGPSTGLPGNGYRALLQDGEKTWVGTDQGLLLYERFQWKMLLPDLHVNAVVKDTDGGLLLGTDVGLIQFDGSQSFLWVINLGEQVLTNPHVTAVARDSRDHLWVGTDGEGVLHYDGKQWEQFDTTRGMPTNSIRQVFVDRYGAVWIAATTGSGGGALVRYAP